MQYYKLYIYSQVPTRWVEMGIDYLVGKIRFAILKVPKCEIFDRSDFPDFLHHKVFMRRWVGGKNINLLF